MGASTMAITDNRIEQAIDRAVDYIASRQCHNGGFCYYRTDDLEEPNLHDTYYAVAACGLVQRQIPNRDKVMDYLRSMGTTGQQSSYLYYYAFTVYLLGELTLDLELLDSLLGLHIAPPKAGKNVPLSGWLEDSFRVIRLQKTFAGYSKMDEIKDFVRNLARPGGVGAKPNLLDTYLALSILAELNGLSGLLETKCFIDRVQLASFGFKYTEDSLFSPNIDILYAGVISCVLLGLRVKYPADIVNSVLVSQRTHGGFTRSPDSLGDLETHYKALEIIHQLWAGKYSLRWENQANH